MFLYNDWLHVFSKGVDWNVSISGMLFKLKIIDSLPCIIILFHRKIPKVQSILFCCRQSNTQFSYSRLEFFQRSSNRPTNFSAKVQNLCEKTYCKFIESHVCYFDGKQFSATAPLVQSSPSQQFTSIGEDESQCTERLLKNAYLLKVVSS